MAFSTSLYDRKLTAGTRKRLFRTAESTVPHRRKSSSDTRKSLFRMAEKPLWRRRKRTLIMSDNISYCVSAEYVKRPKPAYLQPKACLRAKTAVFSRCDVYLYMRPCIFMHASIYICAYSCTGRCGWRRFFFRLTTTRQETPHGLSAASSLRRSGGTDMHISAYLTAVSVYLYSFSAFLNVFL